MQPMQNMQSIPPNELQYQAWSTIFLNKNLKSIDQSNKITPPTIRRIRRQTENHTLPKEEPRSQEPGEIELRRAGGEYSGGQVGFEGRGQGEGKGWRVFGFRWPPDGYSTDQIEDVHTLGPLEHFNHSVIGHGC